MRRVGLCRNIGDLNFCITKNYCWEKVMLSLILFRFSGRIAALKLKNGVVRFSNFRVHIGNFQKIEIQKILRYKFSIKHIKERRDLFF